MIDTSGKWWKGSTPQDIGAYLEALSADNYPVTETRLAKCDCGSFQFALEYEADEGVARRICTQCSTSRFIFDSEENWQDTLRFKKFKCLSCKSTAANTGVGYALNEDKQALRWVYVGVRCARCGILGAVADWKIDYAPSLHLIEKE